MDRLRPVPVTVFCALTLAIWGNRIWLAWTNPDDGLAEKVIWSLPITVFVGVAAVTLVAKLTRGDRPEPTWIAPAVSVFAAGTVAYWVIRMPFIAVAEPPSSVADDERGAFVAVHVVLAIVSVTAAAFAWRAVRSGSPTSSGDA